MDEETEAVRSGTAGKQPGAAELAQIATAQEFGLQLTTLRTQAGLTVRQVARATGLAVSTAGDYFSGRHLPADAQAEQVLKILRACGVTDEDRLDQWKMAMRRARRPAGRRPLADAPYRGLARFEFTDERWFFGREELAERLAELALREPADAAGSAQSAGLSGSAGLSDSGGLSDSAAGSPLVLVGPSGSGKSSLLRAGLAPRLTGPVEIMEPTATPSAALADLLGEPAHAPKLNLIVDQFEKLFTLCQDESQRRAFITRLCEHASDQFVVIALRADFYGHAVRYPALASALQARQVVLGPMTSAQVERAITEPARLARLKVEDGLVALLLRDLAADARELGAYEPGALPLLSHALLATWEQSRGGVLTIAGYLASGGIRDALIQTAEDAYGSLSASQRQLARRLFLTMVHVADDTQPARAAVPLTELAVSEGSDADQVLSRFVSERLITVDAETAQITHDALLTTWPRLTSWISSDTDDLRTRRRITEAARAWDDSGREHAALWRGSLLALARDWATDEDRRASLGTTPLAFVDAAVQADLDQETAARRRTRRLQRLVAALTGLSIVVLGLAGYAIQQRQDVVVARDDANSRATAIEADQLRSEDPAVAAQLSVAAYRIAPTTAAAASLVESSGWPTPARLVDSAAIVQSVSLRPDHKLLAVAAANGTLRLWHVTLPGQFSRIREELGDHSGQPLYTTAFSPDGKVLAAAGARGTVALWDVSNPGHSARLGPELTGPANTVYSVVFSPDGKILAAGSADDSVYLWDVSDPARPRPLGKPLTGARDAVESVAFSPDGKILAAGSEDSTVRLWDVADPAHAALLGKPLTGPTSQVSSVAFSPGGSMLAAAGEDDTVRLWNLRYGPGARSVSATPAGTLLGATSWLNAVAFSPNGAKIAAGGSDASVLVWDVASRSLLARLPQPQPVTSVVWDGARHLASGDANGTVALWRLPSPILPIGNPAYDVAYSPDGRTIAVSSQDNLQLWDATRDIPVGIAAVPGTSVNAVQFAPHARMLAATYGDGKFQLWRTAPRLAPLSRQITAAASSSETVETAAFSPDGSILVTGSDDGVLRIWSLRDPARPALIAEKPKPKTILFDVAFSPDGKTMAATYTDRRTRLWNVSDPAHPTLLGQPLPGTAGYAVSVAFNPNGHLLAVGSADGQVRLWNVANLRRPVLAGRSLIGLTSYVWGVAFSPDGHTLAAAVGDGTVWLWRLASVGQPTLLGTLRGPVGHTYAVAFAPRGGSLAAASADGTVRIWDTSAMASLAAICSAAGQPLTRSEWSAYISDVPYHRPCP